MSAVPDTNQVNFNPTWMQSPVQRGERQGFGRVSIDSDDSKEMMAPVFAQHRYGREDILALEPKSTKPPDGLHKCPFVVEDGQSPIILTSLSETELRLQQNINSSKALSLINHQERINGTGNGPNSPWSRGGKQPGSRWSALTNSDSSPSSNYVKVGSGRGGSGRGGGVSGSFGGRGGFRTSFDKSGSGDRARSRLKSTGEDELPGWTVVGSKSPSQENANVWKSGRSEPLEEHNGFNRSRGTGANQLRPGLGRYSSNTDKFYPDFKRSESHEPALDDWVSGEKKQEERQTSSNSPPVSKSYQSQQHSPFENVPPVETESKLNDSDNEIRQIIQSFTSSPVQEFEKWYYLDPDGKEHGPYEAPQMLIWFKNRFFNDDLRCRRENERNFTTLGELVRSNGSADPFISIRAPIESLNNLNQWRTTEALEAQRLLIEERRRLEEQQEKLRREEQERLEKEQRLRMMEEEVERRRQELHRIALAKEQEIESKRRQLFEIERQREEAAEQQAAELRRLQEEREREKRELEAKQKAAEDLIRREKEKAEQEAVRLRDKALAEARRLALEEAERQKHELLKKQQMENQKYQHEQQRLLIEAQRKRQEEEATSKEREEAVRRIAAASKSAPWVGKVHEKQNQFQTQRSLIEIQLEEEKQLEEQRKKEKELFEQQRRQQKSVVTGPWAGSNVLSVGKVWQPPVMSTKNTVNREWPAIPSTADTTVVKKETNKPQAQAVVNTTTKTEKKKTKTGDGFKEWLIGAISKLNKLVGTNVESEPFAAFIQGIENPDEVEDYFLSYFGESGPVKDFHKEFLEKRIELRPRHKINDKDDLSAAQAAVSAAPIQSLPPAAQPAGKKKKKNKTNKTVDLNVLGFKPAGDSNRINVGEIDNEPPVTPSRKKR